MNSIYIASDFQALSERANQLTAQSQGQWGKMNVAQMLAHCTVGIKTAMGDIHPKRGLAGYLIGPFMRGMLTGKKPMPKNSPTAPEFKITDERDFETEKANFLAQLKRMHEGGEAKCTKTPHAFFGRITPSEWGQGQFQHLDYHFKQFGV